ncbi:acetylglutamate kinase [Salsuginibacillus kocurii]|uniref:acetylglutamate kinase n=1 Tax=Salsuginibacillus kocurii TaxID=427078 RepID=UPI0003645BE7|nr:acetylglutamate kinase [Salsuginibacillus kocurii]
MKEIVVIKCGGSTIESLTDTFFERVVNLKKSGKYPVLVHGGGPAINNMLEALNVEPYFVDGLRQTDAKVLDIAEMVLCGKVQRQLVSKFEQCGAKTIGLSGTDAQLIVAEQVNDERLGLVGQPKEVNTTFIHSLLEQDYIPCIAPIASNGAGERLNVNADSAAAAVADALQAEEMLFITDVDGILKGNQVLEYVTVDEIDQLITNETIYGGMIPKVKAAVQCLEGSIQKVTITNGAATEENEQQTIPGTAIQKAPIQSIN